MQAKEASDNVCRKRKLLNRLKNKTEDCRKYTPSYAFCDLMRPSASSSANVSLNFPLVV
jgi:hypothetical protein